MSTKSFSYEDNIKTVESIIEKMRNQEIPIDQMKKEIKNAEKLLSACEKNLKKIQDEVESKSEK